MLALHFCQALPKPGIRDEVETANRILGKGPIVATIDQRRTLDHSTLVPYAPPRHLPLEKRLGRVLVTGANGFLGSNLAVALLNQGVDALAGVRSEKKIGSEIASQCKPIPYRDFALDSVAAARRSMEGVDVVVHCAGRVAASSYRQFLETNRRGTYHLYRAAAEMDRPPKIVLISSIAAHGPSMRGMKARPDMEVGPVSLYGRSKWMGEMVARRFADRVPTTILRPGIIFGPGDKEVLMLMKMIAASHVNFVPGYHFPRFPFIAVQDLVTCITQAIDVGATVVSPQTTGLSAATKNGEGVYFVADPQSCSFAQFGNWVSRGLGQHWRLNIPVPIWILRIAAGINEQFLTRPDKPSTFSVDKIREAAAPGWECDVSKTMEELDWSPNALLEERVRETIQWYRQHKWL